MTPSAPDLGARVSHHFAHNGGVRLHDATLGEGPPPP